MVVLTGFMDQDPSPSRDSYYYHLRPRRVQIVPDGKHEDSVTVTLLDQKEEQSFEIHFKGAVSSVRLIIRSVYRASLHQDVDPYDVVGLRRVSWHSD